MNRVSESYSPRVVTATGLVDTGDGVVAGMIVSSGTALTVKLWDNTAASGTVIMETTTPVTPAQPFFLPIACAYSTGLFVTIGGTGAITLLIE